MKIKYLFALTLLVAGSAAFSAADASKPFRLFQFFSDQEKKVPRDGEPYTIFLDGKVASFGVTGDLGAVVTDKRIAKTSQEFVMQLFLMGTYSLKIDADERIAITKVGPWPEFVYRKTTCKRDKSDCNGKGFYWLQLMGKDTDFEAEPYALMVGGQLQTGLVAKDGYIVVPQNDAPEASAPMRLQLCGGRAFNVVSGWKLNNMSVTPAAAAAAAGPALVGCEKSGVSEYAQEYAQFNGGAPYIFTQWVKGQTPAEVAQQAAAKERQVALEAALKKQDEAEEYRKMAIANNDNLAWLGRLPLTWSEKAFTKKVNALFEKTEEEVRSDRHAELQTFQCKLPAQVGPIPDQKAVDNYLAEFPVSIDNERLLRPLYAAAAKGNWLAAVQIYELNMKSNLEGNEQVLRYRIFQLGEWLLARKIGAFYREYGKYATGLSSSQGNSATEFDIYAALHASYPAQLEVGRELSYNDNPELKAIGKKMIACANSASPAYEKRRGSEQGHRRNPE